jgi:DNA repair protein RadC
VAALSSKRLYDLVDRYLFRGREDPPLYFDIVRPTFTAVRGLADVAIQSPHQTDQAWLGRYELRGGAKVVQYLESSEFPAQAHASQTLLLDERCGLIDTLFLGKSSDAHSPSSITQILRRAAECHAAGMILATNDPDGAITKSPACRAFTLALYNKGTAIGVHLLDHFVRAEGQWKRMMALKSADLI